VTKGYRVKKNRKSEGQFQMWKWGLVGCTFGKRDVRSTLGGYLKSEIVLQEVTGET